MLILLRSIVTTFCSSHAKGLATTVLIKFAFRRPCTMELSTESPYGKEEEEREERRGEGEERNKERKGRGWDMKGGNNKQQTF